VQVGGVAATVALAAGLFALRARDAAPQASLITAVPEAIDTPEIPQPTAATEAKEQAMGELEALHKQPQAAPEPPSTQQQPAQAPSTAPTAQAAKAPSTPEPKAKEAAPAQEVASAEPAAKPASEAASQKPAAAESQAAVQTSKAPAQGNAAQVLAKGRTLEQKGKKQDAIDLYAKAVEEGSADSQLLSRMAFLYLNQGKNALAEAAAKRAADADETNSEAWIVLGAAQDGLGKKQAAEQAYRSCAAKGQGQYVTECKRMLR
jgi:Flp pilus assembly protein TadD